MLEEMEEKKGLSSKAKGIIAGSAAVGAAAIIGVVSVVALGGTAPEETKKPVSYSVSISSELEGFEDANFTINKGTKIKDLKTMITSPVAGYRVEGFYKDALCTDKYDDEALITEATTIYVNFAVITFTVRAYKTQADTEPEVLTVEYNKKARPTTPSKEADEHGSYKFTGWVNIRGEAVDLNNILSDMDIYATFAIKEYNEYTIADFAENVRIVKGTGEETTELTTANTLHYGDRVKITYSESEGHQKTVFNVTGATAVEVDANRNGWYEITGDLSVTYAEERLAFVVGELQEGVTLLDKEGNTITAESTLLYGDIVTLEITPTKGYEVSERTIEGLRASALAGTNKYAVVGNVSVSFTEEIKSFKIEITDENVVVTRANGATVTSGETLTYGETITIQVNDRGGYHVTAVYVNEEEFTNGGTHTVTGDVNISYLEERKDILYLNYKEYEDGYMVSGLKDDSVTEVIIPATYKNKKVYGIRDVSYSSAGAFYNKNITSVIIEEGVENIGNYAFSSCSSLTSIIIPEGVANIGQGAFSSCSSLTSVTIPSSVKSIGSSAFSGCSITSVTIPESLTSIGNYAFNRCSSLTSIIIPEGVTSIGQGAFQSCSSLTSITIPESVISIGDSAFNSCSSLTSVTIPEGVPSIGYGIFGGCGSLTSVTIPDSVTSIGRDAFSRCSSLTSIIIPEGVTSIGSSAFNSCSSLTSIIIPSSVTSIVNSAFWYCYGLVEVYNLSSLNITAGSNDNGGVASYAKKVYTTLEEPSKLVTRGDYIMYEDAENNEYYLVGYKGTETDLVLPNTENNYEINKFAFYENKNIKSITIPSSVTNILNYAFSKCSSLISITITEGVPSIGYGAFSDCCGLTSITIPSSVTSIRDKAFDGCYKLVEVYNLSSLNITAGSNDNGGVASYAKNVYTATEGLSKLVNRDGYIMYEDAENNEYYLMGYTGTETNLVLPNTDYKYEIYKYAFYYNRNITSITIPEGVTNIGSYAFNGCYALASVNFEDPTGWYVADSETATSGTDVTLTNTSTNATYLKSTYSGKYWKKK